MVNYDTDLAGLVSSLQFYLQSAPDAPLIFLEKLSYREQQQQQQQESSLVRGDGKRASSLLVPLDAHTFHRDVFLHMTKVYLLAHAQVGTMAAARD